MQSSYDYVVVGAGSAGCIVADRLTEDQETSVLVLEAGDPDEKEEIKSPLAWATLLKTSLDWDYMSVPQRHLHDRETYQPRGKVLGGSGSLNGMVYFRGHPHDYDHWAKRGNDGWSFEEMLPYFKRAEDFAGGDSEYRNTGGKLHIKKQPHTTELAKQHSEAAQAVGFEWNEDLNAGEMAGIGQAQVNIKNGQRHSTADAYLKPALSRQTLDAETGAQVTGLRFDNDRVVGVTFEQNGKEHNVDAEKEVILSAGAFGSPHLLLLSGIGDAAQLEEHGIDVVTHLPGVGKNLQDHLLGGVSYESPKSVEIGPSDHLTQNIAFEHTDEDSPTPDLIYFFNNALFMRHGFDNPEGVVGYTITFHMTHPESRGEVTLRSANPFDDPRIDPNYMSDERDLEGLIHGVKRVREIVDADPLDEYRGDELGPGNDVQTDEDIAEYLRETTTTAYHPVGTCKMGTDEMAVVDNRLRVRGVDGLRVVDASVMPLISVANTQGAVIGVAERAADMIKEDV